jgi:hypothetical protein
MKISITWKVFLAVVLVQIVTAVVIVGWFFYSIRPEIDRLVVQNAQQTVMRSVEATEKFFGPVDTAIQATRHLIAGQVLDRNRPEQLVRYLHDKLLLWPQFAGFYVGYPDGDFYYVMRDNTESAKGTRTKIISHSAGQRDVTLTWRDADYSIVRTAKDPGDSYDPRTRPWYQAAAEKSEVVWTEPYIFFTSRKPGITAAVGVDDGKDEPAAVVGIDIEINQVSKYLGQIAFGPKRSAFVVSPQGEIISHSDIDTVLTNESVENGKPRFLKLSELDRIDQSVRDGIVAHLSDQSIADVPAVWQERTSGGDHIVAVGRISSANWPWQIVTIRPKAEMIGVSSGSDIMLIVIVLLATAVAVGIGYLLARSIDRSIAALWANAKLARAGNFELMEEVSSGYREIDETADILAELAKMRRNRGSSPPS